MCDPVILDVGCRPVTVTITDTATCFTIGHQRPPRRLPLIRWTFGPVQDQILFGPVQVLSMTQLTDSQFVTGVVTPINKKGNPAPVQAGSVVFSSSDPAVLTAVADAANELSVTVTSVAPGAARLSCTFDADLGDGVQTVELFEDFSVVGGPAIGGTLVFGPPAEQA